MKDSPSTREDHIRHARCILAQVPHFMQRKYKGGRDGRSCGFILLEWAANARRRAAATPKSPFQQRLF